MLQTKQRSRIQSTADLVYPEGNVPEDIFTLALHQFPIDGPKLVKLV